MSTWEPTPPASRHTYPEIIDRDGIREQSIAAMRAVREDGVRTIIDVSTFDLGA